MYTGLKVITGNDVKFCSYLISTVYLLYLVISMHVVLNSFTRLIITVINSNLRETEEKKVEVICLTICALSCASKNTAITNWF